MLPKHSKDIVFIVIILLLIGVIWGVPKESWILISVNVIVIMVGILYVKLNGIIEDNNIKIDEEEKELYEQFGKNKNLEDTYEALKEIVEEELEEFLEEANYERFENVIKGKEIANDFVKGKLELNEAIRKIKSVCKFKLQVYYLGLSLITSANIDKMTEKDYDYIALGVRLIRGVNLENDTELVKFLRKTKLKINE